MVKRLTVIWIVGLLSLVPFGVYFLFVHARRDQYALVITTVLFWIFGYWGVVTPLASAWRVHRLWQTLVQIRSGEELRRLIQGPETREAAIDLLAGENRVPRFVVEYVYRLMEKRLANPPSRPPDRGT
jgi:hypothetical protein